MVARVPALQARVSVTTARKKANAAKRSAEELIGIARALEGLSHGVLQAVSDFDMERGRERFEAEFEVLARMLTHWARDRAHGKLPLERVVKMLTHDTSRYIGLADRGTLEVGQRADINVIDFDHLTLTRPKLVQDLPAGGKRLLQESLGYKATFVRGVQTVANGVLTGAKPGRLARIGA